jgi:hypothetical protein
MEKDSPFRVNNIEFGEVDEDGNPLTYLVTTKKGKQREMAVSGVTDDFRAANQDHLKKAAANAGRAPVVAQEASAEPKKSSTSTTPQETQQMDNPETGEGNAPVAAPADDGTVNANVAPASPATTTLTDTSTSTQENISGIKLAQKYVNAQTQANIKTQKALGSVADAAQAEASAKAAIHTNHALELEDENNKAQAKRIDTENSYKETLDLANKFVLDLKNEEVDAGRWWTEGGTGRKVGAAISILLGGLGQALTGAQTNAAWEIINSAIEKDIEAQKANIKKADLAAGRATDIVSQLRQKQLGDAEVDKLFRLHKLQQLESTLNAVTESSKLPMARANGELAIAKVQQEQAALEADINRVAYSKAVNNSKNMDEVVVKPKSKDDKGLKTPAAVATRLINTRAIVDGLDDAINKIDLSDTGLGEVAERKFKKKLMQHGIFTDEESAAEFARSNQLLSRIVVAASGAATTDQERAFYESFMPMFANDPRMAKASAEELVAFMKREYNSVLDSAQKLENEGVMGLDKFDLGQSSGVGFTTNAGQ